MRQIFCCLVGAYLDTFAHTASWLLLLQPARPHDAAAAASAEIVNLNDHDGAESHVEGCDRGSRDQQWCCVAASLCSSRTRPNSIHVYVYGSISNDKFLV